MEPKFPSKSKNSRQKSQERYETFLAGRRAANPNTYYGRKETKKKSRSNGRHTTGKSYKMVGETSELTLEDQVKSLSLKYECLEAEVRRLGAENKSLKAERERKDKNEETRRQLLQQLVNLDLGGKGYQARGFDEKTGATRDEEDDGQEPTSQKSSDC